MTPKEKFLLRTSFKNVSGNWQFNGDMSPERALRIMEDLNPSIDYASQLSEANKEIERLKADLKAMAQEDTVANIQLRDALDKSEEEIERLKEEFRKVLPYLKATGTNGNHFVHDIESLITPK